MATKRQVAAEHIRKGLSPSDVVKEMEKFIGEVRIYLLQQIAEGELLGTDVLASFGDDTRKQYEQYIGNAVSEEYWDLINGSTSAGIDREQLRLYLDCRKWVERDLYEYIATLEVFLHEKIRQTLVSEYGENEEGWWREGIPSGIRLDCVTTREVDSYMPGEPYTYTTFIHLSRIIEKNWKLFLPILPPKYANDKRELSHTFNRLNHVRNAVMHPVKQIDFDFADVEFVRDTCESLGKTEDWRKAEDD